jgi:uncharacterized Fe-S center protein
MAGSTVRDVVIADFVVLLSHFTGFMFVAIGAGVLAEAVGVARAAVAIGVFVVYGEGMTPSI